MLCKNMDLHLLECFHTLVTERSVTRAAERMNMSQPGMSNALARLREMLADPILVRTPQGMMPTPRAVVAAEGVRNALGQLSVALASPDRFTPGAARDTFKVVCLDYTALSALTPIARRLRAQAPHIEIITTSLAHLRVREPLEDGAVDLVIGYFVDLPHGLYASHVHTDELCCVVASDGEFSADELTLERYMDADHCLLIVPQGPPTTMELVTDRTLARLEVKRKIWLRVPYMNVVAATVAQSDLIATLPKGAARLFANYHAIAYRPLPFSAPPYSLTMVWHERTHQNAAFVWFRQQLRESFSNVPVAPP